jgi:hypothetical protein
MSDEPSEDIRSLAEEYLDTLSSDVSANVNEVEKELDYWQEQVDEFEGGTPMYEMAVEEREKHQERLNDVTKRGERQSELRAELLDRASTEFAPQGDWIDETVISAVTHSLIGEQRSRIFIGDHDIPKHTDELSKREIVTIAKNVHAVAEHTVDSNEAIDQVWDKMSTEKVFPITRTIARSDSPLSASEISEKVGDDGPDDPGSNLRYVITSSEYHPFYREDGEWSFSLLGEYAWKVFGTEYTEEELEEDESNEEDQQFSFDDISNAGGDRNE